MMQLLVVWLIIYIKDVKLKDTLKINCLDTFQYGRVKYEHD